MFKATKVQYLETPRGVAYSATVVDIEGEEIATIHHQGAGGVADVKGLTEGNYLHISDEWQEWVGRYFTEASDAAEHLLDVHDGLTTFGVFNS